MGFARASFIKGLLADGFCEGKFYKSVLLAGGFCIVKFYGRRSGNESGYLFL